MRSSNEIGSDGLYNFISAIWTACSDESYDKGVLVVMNDEIHTARYVTKHIQRTSQRFGRQLWTNWNHCERTCFLRKRSYRKKFAMFLL